MASLHVIFDPHDKCVGFSSEGEKRLGIKVARLSIAENLTTNEIKTYAVELGRLILEQVYIERGKP